MGRRACVPVRVLLFGISAGNVLLSKKGGVLRLPETWLEEGETICEAARRLAASIVEEPGHVRPVAVVWFAESMEDSYHLVFAVEVFLDTEPKSQEEYILLEIGDAVKLVDEPLHRQFLTLMHVFKPRPLLVCEAP